LREAGWLVNSALSYNELVLTAAFDLVDVEFLTKELYTGGMPRDVVKLIKLWLSGRTFFVMCSNPRLNPGSNPVYYLHHYPL
jgi:hypothetical protein